MNVSDIIGFIGVALILGAYFLNVFHKVDRDDYAYLITNFLGGTLACISSYIIDSVPFIILEGTWALVSMIAIVRKVRSNKS